MEILIVTHKFHNSTGGMEKHCRMLTEGLGSKYITHVIAPKPGENKAAFMLSVRRKMKLAIESNNIRLIYFNDCLIAMIGGKIGKRYRIPMVATAHGLDITYPSQLYKRQLQQRLPDMAEIICVSRHTADKARSLGINSARLSVIANGVSLPEGMRHSSEELKAKLLGRIEHIQQEKKIIFCVGRIVQRKGYTWFIKNVLPELQQEAILVMAGPISSKNNSTQRLFSILPVALRRRLEVALGYDNEEFKIQELMSHPRYQHLFLHLGRLTDEELSCMYQLSDICIMPNIEVKGDVEGFGLVALEAGVYGKTMVAAGIQGLNDAIQSGKNGLLLPSQNPKVWIDTLKHILNNEEISRELGRKARAYNIEHFTWDKMVSKYVSSFDRHISKERRVTIKSKHVVTAAI